MILFELFTSSAPEFQDMSQDSSQYKITDTRKTRLTLAQLNRLRKMNDLRKLEHAQELQFIKKMYGMPPAAPNLGF